MDNVSILEGMDSPGTGSGRRKPDWLRIQLTTNENYQQVRRLLRDEDLHTVCEEARCPNLHECWALYRTATFMILGDTCTRRCRFCAVKTGMPGAVDWGEPDRLADAVKRMALRHVVVTMVNRDDLPDGGAGVLAATVAAIRESSPSCSIELLSSDLMGRRESIEVLVASAPNILSHNIETVRRLTPLVRSRSTYERSLSFLRSCAELAPEGTVKSSMMLGLGEERGEVLESMDDLLACGVTILNLGQYLQPEPTAIPVARYWRPEEFAELRERAVEKGFRHCEAGPLVRSSYHAEDQYRRYLERGGDA